MALVYDGSNGLFTRLGKIIYLMDLVRGYQSTIVTEIGDIKAEYTGTTAYMVAALGDAEAQAKSLDPLLRSLQASAAETLIEMCYAEATAGNANAMLNKSTQDALVWLIKQMKTDSETIERNTVGKGTLTADGTNNGNGTVVSLLETPNILLGNSANWPNIRAEVLDIRCISDAQNGAIARGSEIFQIRGQPAFETLDRRFPAGSGRSIQAVALCATVDSGPRYQNILTNSDFETQTSNVPDNFTVSSGTAGTDFLTETTASNVYRGASSIKAAATGTTWKIRQQLGAGAGTVGKLTPDRPYVIAFAAKKDASATGTIRVSVQDGSGNILGGGTFAATAAHGALTTSFSLVTATVFAPRVIPTDTYLVVETTVGVATAAMYIDEVIIAEMVQLAPGSQYLAILSGSSDFDADDNFSYTFTNTGNGAFAVAFDRLFDMYGIGLCLPDAASPGETIADSLIA